MRNDIGKMAVKRNSVGDFAKAMLGAANLSLMSSQIFVEGKMKGALRTYYYADKFNWEYVLIIAATILLLVKIMPFTKSYENIWVFLFTFTAFIPMNIKLADFIQRIVFEWTGFLRGIWCVILWFVLISVEEIVMGLIARLIWRKQKEFKHEEKEGYLQLCKESDELAHKLSRELSDYEDDYFSEFLGGLD